MPEKLQELKRILSEAEGIVFLGGAGVSTESGIPDFRSENGIFKAQEKFGHTPEMLLSRSFFLQNPKTFFSYFRTMLHLDAPPNAAHHALAELEERGGLRTVITQNIDGLHQKAGSEQVLELHGSILRHFCMQCGQQCTVEEVVGKIDARGSEHIEVPRCDACGGIIRPDVVLYEEPLDADILNAAIRAVANADVLIVGGTSLVVYPAASLLDYFSGNELILINKTETPQDKFASLVIHDSIGKVLGEACR